MSTSIPDGISFKDLEGLADNAQREEDITPTPTYGTNGATQADVHELVDKLLDQAANEIHDPMVFKIFALETVSRLMGWHTNAGLDQIKNDEEHSGICWLRDAGKLQACIAILTGITVGNDDWTFRN